MQVNHEQLKEVLRLAHKQKIPVFIQGNTGIGKSEIVREVAKEFAKEANLEFTDNNHYSDTTKYHLTIQMLAQCDSTDLRGILYFDSTKSSTINLRPNWMPEDGHGIIFLDEFNLAPPLVQASAYQLVLDNKVGEHKLSKDYWVLAAGNLDTDRANTYELPPPLANRFLHLELKKPSIEDWTEWALQHNIDSRIIGFLQFRPEYLHKFNDKQADNAFPTPRVWSKYCSPMIKGINDNKLLKIIAAGAVGEGVAIEFVAFTALLDKINIKDVLANPDTFTIPEQINMKYALISALSDQYKENPKLLSVILKICNRLVPDEFQVFLLKSLKTFSGDKWIERINVKDADIKREFSKLSSKHSKYFSIN